MEVCSASTGLKIFWSRTCRDCVLYIFQKIDVCYICNLIVSVWFLCVGFMQRKWELKCVTWYAAILLMNADEGPGWDFQQILFSMDSWRCHLYVWRFASRYVPGNGADTKWYYTGIPNKHRYAKWNVVARQTWAILNFTSHIEFWSF